MTSQTMRFLMATAALVLLHSAAQAAAAPDISGVYWTNSYAAKIQPVGGGELPYKPEAMASYKQNQKDIAANTFDDQARTFCTPDGVPRVLASPYPFEIVQVPNRQEIYLIFEINRMIRMVDMVKPMPSEEELANLPFFGGRSYGHWDGNTLVINSGGFNDRTFLDNAGAPHSDQLTTVEHIRKINGGKQLEDVITIHDPVVFTKDWSARFVYQPRSDVRLTDWNCGEKHRDISSVKGVHVPQ